MLKIYAIDSMCVLSLLVFTQLFFGKLHGLSQPNWHENRTKRKIAIQGHSRSHIWDH